MAKISAEVDFLKHILRKGDAPDFIKKLGKEFLSLQNEAELKEFAKKIKIDTDGLSSQELREKIAYDIIEKYFTEKEKLRKI